MRYFGVQSPSVFPGRLLRWPQPLLPLWRGVTERNDMLFGQSGNAEWGAAVLVLLLPLSQERFLSHQHMECGNGFSSFVSERDMAAGLWAEPKASGNACLGRVHVHCALAACLLPLTVS